jgi:hypothetical protein
MSELSSNQIGDEAEVATAKLIGGRRVAGSGSTRFIKLDVNDAARFIYSVEASQSILTTSMRAISKLWQEAIRGTRGYAGHGDGAKPALVFSLGGEVLVIMRLADHAELATGETAPYIAPDAAQTRRERSRSSKLA